VGEAGLVDGRTGIVDIAWRIRKLMRL